MINFNTDQRLRILLSNTNKALAEAIKQATPAQLELMQEGKDIRGVLNTLAGEAARSDKSAAVLSDILKNSPVFQSMGNLADDLKALVETMKSDKSLLSLQTKLETFLKPVPDTLSPEALKRQISDSGVFLESKLAASADPKSELKTLLRELDTLLKASDMKVAQTARRHIAALLEHPVFIPGTAPDTAALKRLTDAIETILRPLQNTLAKSDVLHGREIARLLERLDAFTRLERPAQGAETGKIYTDIKPQSDASSHRSPLPAGEPQHASGKTTVHDAKSAASALSAETASALKSRPSATTGPQEPKTAPYTSQQPSSEIPSKTAASSVQAPAATRNLLQFSWVQNALNEPRYAASEPLRKELMAAPERFIVTTLKEVLNDLHGVILQSSRPESKGLLNLLEKIFGLVNAKAAEPFAVLDDPDISTSVKTFVDRLQTFIGKADPLLKKEAAALLKELAPFTEVQRLVPGAGTERISNDLKGVLLQTHEQLQNSAAPNASDMARQVDKLILQIDYYQLTSYLSNSTALFFPYSWEMLEDGSLRFKKGKERTFYCRIDLTLKEFGALHLMLALSGEKQIDIQAYTEKEGLQALLREQMPLLRAALRDAGLVPQKINVSHLTDHNGMPKGYDGSDGDLEMGFEVTI